MMPQELGKFDDLPWELSWFIVEASTDGHTYKMEPQLRDGVTVSLSVNGVEVDFERSVKHLLEQYDEQVDRSAKRIIEEEFEGLDNALREARNAASELVLLTTNRLKKERGW
jgi:cell wall assembly regulator SMI1